MVEQSKLAGKKNTILEARHEKQTKESIHNITFPHLCRCNPQYTKQADGATLKQKHAIHQILFCCLSATFHRFESKLALFRELLILISYADHTKIATRSEKKLSGGFKL